MDSKEMIRTIVSAGKIINRLQNGSWTDTTFDNLMNDCRLDPDNFHIGLDYLLDKNKVFLFETPKETYVFPQK